MNGTMRNRMMVLTLSSLLLAACGSSKSSTTTPDAGTPDAGSNQSPTIVKFATMNSAQETTGSTSTAFGAGALIVDTTTGKVGGFIITHGLVAPTAAHVHQSTGRGVAGGIIVPLSGGPDLWVVPDGATALTADQIAAFQAGNLYFNAHTTANPGGDIRGQIDKAGTATFASMNSAQETTGSTSTAFGAGALVVDVASGKVGGFITTSGLVSPTAAHVHLSTGRGVAGAIIVPLSGGPDLWVVPDAATALTADQITAFQAGNLYFNAHTTANPGGDIRGQIDKIGTAAFASMDSAQETTGSTSTAFGAGALEVDTTSGKVGGFIVTHGLVAPTAAHVHQSTGRGVAGAIIVPLSGGPDLWVVPDAATALTADQIAAFQAGDLYYNAHTAANPGGDIRGEIDKR
jgi:uncharacterized cupin superfamily protein